MLMKAMRGVCSAKMIVHGSCWCCMMYLGLLGLAVWISFQLGVGVLLLVGRKDLLYE
jgi:hypothetical protein